MRRPITRQHRTAPWTTTASPAPLRLFALAGLLTVMLGGCTVVGPTAISSGRLVYNEAITATDNQQILMVLVHNRYGERGHLLNVASVTANVSVTTSAGVQAGFGSNERLRRQSGALCRQRDLRGEPHHFLYPSLRGTIPATTDQPHQPRHAHSSSPAPTPTRQRPGRPGERWVNGIYNPDFNFSEQQDDPSFRRVPPAWLPNSAAHTPPAPGWHAAVSKGEFFPGDRPVRPRSTPPG